MAVSERAIYIKQLRVPIKNTLIYLIKTLNRQLKIGNIDGAFLIFELSYDIALKFRVDLHQAKALCFRRPCGEIALLDQSGSALAEVHLCRFDRKCRSDQQGECQNQAGEQKTNAFSCHSYPQLLWFVYQDYTIFFRYGAINEQNCRNAQVIILICFREKDYLRVCPYVKNEFVQCSRFAHL